MSVLSPGVNPTHNKPRKAEKETVIMTITQLIAQLRGQVATKLEQRNAHTKTLAELRSAETTDQARVDEIRAAKDALDREVDDLEVRIASLQAEQAKDDAADELSRQVHPAAPAAPAYDQVARIGQEKRTYNPDTDRDGTKFLRDVGAQFLRLPGEANDRLSRHMQEELVERNGQVDRAAGTGAFSGLVVPQYLTDQYASLARAGRPFADACRHHDLPPDGMNVYLSKITTGTTTADQTENNAVSETNIDDTLLTVALRTNAGQQTVSRQAIERGLGVEGVVLEDLMRAYSTTLDSQLINVGTTGLAAVATSVAYTDATPTGPELYPKILGGIAAVEASLLDSDPGDTIAVMHSRRWYWLQSQMTSTWPLFGQPGTATQTAGVNYGTRYGSGFRGLLPCGTPVIVDNNCATNIGAGTEDEIYLVAQSEAHLWEDASAPLLIRAEQPSAASLGVLFVVYGYYGFTATRRAHAQRISGTGLIAPTF